MTVANGRGLIGGAALLSWLNDLDQTDAVAVRHFNSLAAAYLSKHPVIRCGYGVLVVRLDWNNAPSTTSTLTRFPPLHKLPQIRAWIRVKALERGEALGG